YFENIEPLYNMIEDISPIRTPLELRYYFGQLGLLRYEDKAIRSFIKENSHNPEFALYYREYYSFIYRYGKECLDLSDKEVYEYSLSTLRVLYLGLNRYHFPRLAMSFLDELDAHYEILEKLDCSKRIAELDASLSRYLKQIIYHLAQNNKENNLINLFSFLGKSLNLLNRLNKYSRAQYAEVFYLLRKTLLDKGYHDTFEFLISFEEVFSDPTIVGDSGLRKAAIKEIKDIIYDFCPSEFHLVSSFYKERSQGNE
ncbi:MAG: hypothetical protein K5694_05465, partial [Bacilli bacterium]|nr:hypothetical protein [Bacilli bacterium]